MKVAIPVLSIKHHGGTKILIEVANKLCSHFEVDFLVPEGLVNTNFQIKEEVNIKEIYTLSKNKHLKYLEFLIKLPWFLRNYNLIIANFFVTFYPTLITSILFKKKYIYIVQDIESKYTDITGKFLNFLCELTYKSKNIICANSYLEEELFKRGTVPLFTFTVGLSKEFFLRKKENSKKYDIIYFARKEPWKGLPLFLKFLNKFNKLRLKVAIVSQDQDALQYFKNLSSFHELFIYKPKDILELIKIIDQSKIFISTSFKEGFSLPPLEAMSRGLIVLLYPSGGPAIYIKDKENAFYFKSLAELENLVYEVLINEESYKYIKEKAIETASNFQLETELDKLKKFIESLFKESNDDFMVITN